MGRARQKNKLRLNDLEMPLIFHPPVDGRAMGLSLLEHLLSVMWQDSNFILNQYPVSFFPWQS